MVTDIDDRTDGINSGSIGAALSLKGPCRDVATIVDDWYDEWDDLSADSWQEPDDDIDPFVIG